MDGDQLSPPVPRRPMHRRSVQCDGYLRDDGQWEVEARLLDTKGYALIHHARGPLEAGAAAHDMTLRLTIDDELRLTAIEAEMAITPMLTCQDVRRHLPLLIGVRFVSGWRKAVRERIQERDGCTHLSTLIDAAVTTLYQTSGMGKEPEGRNALEHVRNSKFAPGRLPFFVDRCHGWRADGPAVQEHLPQFAATSDVQEAGREIKR